MCYGPTMWGLCFIPGPQGNTYHFINILFLQVALSAKNLQLQQPEKRVMLVYFNSKGFSIFCQMA